MITLNTSFNLSTYSKPKILIFLLEISDKIIAVETITQSHTTIRTKPIRNECFILYCTNNINVYLHSNSGYTVRVKKIILKKAL